MLVEGDKLYAFVAKWLTRQGFGGRLSPRRFDVQLAGADPLNRR